MSSSTSPPSASRKPTSQTQSKDERLERSWRRGITPPRRISVPEWADRFRKLAPEAGSTSGNWSTRTVEIARGPTVHFGWRRSSLAPAHDGWASAPCALSSSSRNRLRASFRRPRSSDVTARPQGQPRAGRPFTFRVVAEHKRQSSREVHR